MSLKSPAEHTSLSKTRGIFTKYMGGAAAPEPVWSDVCMHVGVLWT